MTVSRPDFKFAEFLKPSQSIIEKVSVGCDETFIDLLTKLESAGALESFEEVTIGGSLSTLTDETLEKTTPTRRSIDHAADPEFDPVDIGQSGALAGMAAPLKEALQGVEEASGNRV
jgi:hypothetical protein